MHTGASALYQLLTLISNNFVGGLKEPKGAKLSVHCNISKTFIEQNYQCIATKNSQFFIDKSLQPIDTTKLSKNV
jgi:hypothetical protein